MDANTKSFNTDDEKGFNPRARDGREVLSVCSLKLLCGVSIHAPVMDANQPLTIRAVGKLFQSTRP